MMSICYSLLCFCGALLAFQDLFAGRHSLRGSSFFTRLTSISLCISLILGGVELMGFGFHWNLPLAVLTALGIFAALTFFASLIDTRTKAVQKDRVRTR